MRLFDHLLPSSPDECQRELARILARGLLRLRGHLPPEPESIKPTSALEKPSNSSPNCLELPADLSVTVHTG